MLEIEEAEDEAAAADEVDGFSLACRLSLVVA